MSDVPEGGDPLQAKLPPGTALVILALALIPIILLSIAKLVPDEGLVHAVFVGPFGAFLIVWLSLSLYVIWKVANFWGQRKKRSASEETKA